MQYALVDGKPFRASDIAPGKNPENARCPYCGLGVRLRQADTSLKEYAYAWVHLTRADAAACETARAKEQAELYAILGGE
jgi:hypothetical protein